MRRKSDPPSRKAIPPPSWFNSVRVPLRQVVPVALAFLAVSCAPEAALPPSAPAVTITMDEYRFLLDKAVPPGRVVFHARNRGERPHQVTFLKLPEGAQLKARPAPEARAQAISPVAVTRAVAPGETVAFASDLSAGNYGLLCSVLDPDGENHTIKGMVTQFRIP